MKFAVITCVCAGVLAALGCADGRGGPTSPSAVAAASRLAATVPNDASLPAAPRSGDLHVTKECSQVQPVCTILTSNVKAIEVGSKILYLQPDQIGTLAGSPVVLDPPGPGNNKASGNCSLARGRCTFSGGTGKVTTFKADVAVSFNSDEGLFHWDGTYSFDPQG